MASDYKKVFIEIYSDNAWNSSESRSGPGSTIQSTRDLVSQLPDLFKRLNVKNILDLPCGDFNWMSQVPMESIDYTGADIVEDLISSNQSKYPDKTFVCLDLLTDELPTADLVICRDCLGHFPNHAVRKALFNVCESGAKYFLTTNFPNHTSTRDINFGGWRPINLVTFGLPEPTLTLNEGLKSSGVEDKSMSLWPVDSIKIALMFGEQNAVRQ
jgi:2-polyprenyl-3-methyl-5-hydroxy-6-metoxy-1,4-benzoquinol methylase